MSRRVALRLVAVLLLPALWPTLVLAQQPRAGVVTTLQGSATVARAAVPQALPLKFRDDVFFRDRINTAENSIVRVLLGGKALVTVRELSVLTITEEQGRSTVDMEAGKIALGVARQRLLPGESLEIRTPNAIAGVRGTVVIVEILRATAQVAPGPVAAVTNFYVLRGAIDVLLRAVPGAVPVTVGAFQSLNITGATLGQVRAISPGAVGQILQGLKAAPQHGDAPEGAKQAVSQVQQGQATALATALTGGPAQQGDPVLAAASSPATTPSAPSTPTTTTTTTPTTEVISTTTTTLTTTTTTTSSTNLLTNGGFETGTTSGWTVTGAGSVISQFGSITPYSGSYMLIGHTETGASSVSGCGSGNPCQESRISQAITVGSVLNISFKYVLLSNEYPAYTTTSSIYNDKYKVTLTDSSSTVTTLWETTVNDEHSNFTAASSSVTVGGFTLGSGAGQTGWRSTSRTVVASSGSATLEFIVQDISDTYVESAGLLDVVVVTQDPPLYFLRDGSAFTRTHAEPLLQFSGTPQTFDSAMVVCCNSSATLAGPLLRATDSDLNVPFSLLSVIQGGLLTTSTTEPLVFLSGGTHVLGRDVGVFDIWGVNKAVDAETGLTLGTDTPLRHGGAFLETSGASVTTQTVLKLDTALLEASAPLLHLTAGSTLTTNSNAVDLSVKAKVTSLGSLIKLDASTLNVASGAAVSLAGGSVLRVTGDLFQLTNGSTLRLLNGSLLSVSGGSVLNVSGSLLAFGGTGGNTVSITNSLCPCTLIGGIPVALTAGALASNVSITNAIKNASLGSLNLSSSNTAAIVVSGSTSKVTISGN